MDELKPEVLRHFRAQLEDQKREIELYYANLKLKLPTYVKALTIKQLRDAGGIVDPNVHIPSEAQDELRPRVDVARKKIELMDRLRLIREQHKNQIVSYYKDVKQRLPDELRHKKLGDLDDKEWACIDIEMAALRGTVRKNNR